MPKRFTDTEKWKKDFIRGLPSEYKLFWLYIIDDCTNAGIWEVEIGVAELRLGIKLSKEKARGLFEGKVVELDKGTKWFIPDFIFFQYGQLTKMNRAHIPVISALKKFSLIDDGLNIVFNNKEVIGPLQGAKDKEQAKDKELDMEQEGVLRGKFSDPLNEHEAGKTVEYVRITLHRDYDLARIETLWTAFCIQHETKYYPDRDEKVNHFRNWIKTLPNESDKRNTARGGGKPGTSEARVEALKKW